MLSFSNKKASWALGACLLARVQGLGGELQFPPGRNPPGCTIVETDPEEFRGRPTGIITQEMKQEILRRKRGNGAPLAPDLDVTYIERTPRYPRYRVQYSPPHKNPHLSYREEKLQRWPFEGYVVTFHAHVINKGLRPSKETDWVLSIDGEPLPYGRGKLKGLDPLEETVIQVKWHWQSGRHEVSFEVDSGNEIREITERNNKVSDWTDAYTFFLTVQDRAHIAHECVKNSYGSYSAESWVRSVMQWMNWSFAQCKYPTTPQGIPARVRLDYYVVHPEPWETHRKHPMDPFFDATWMHCPSGVPRRNEAMEQYRERIENACIEYAESNSSYHALKKACDKNLAKQLGGQLGLINLHRMHLHQNRCFVRTQKGPYLRDLFPQKASHRPGIKGLMEYGNPARLIWSEHSANALKNDYCRRRGYAGDFLLDLPERSYVRFLDKRNKPVAKAVLTVYQSEGDKVADEVKRRGMTDENGFFDLGGNPFGEVNVRGSNGLLLFRVERAEKDDVDWVWLNILDLYLAKQRGQVTRAVISLKTTF